MLSAVRSALLLLAGAAAYAVGADLGTGAPQEPGAPLDPGTPADAGGDGGGQETATPPDDGQPSSPHEEGALLGVDAVAPTAFGLAIWNPSFGPEAAGAKLGIYERADMDGEPMAEITMLPGEAVVVPLHDDIGFVWMRRGLRYRPLR